MDIMFQPWEMGNLKMRNRIVRSATDETLSTDHGAPTQRLIDVLVGLAKGGVGLIIAGTAYISREGRWGRNTTGINDDRLIKPLRHLCEEVHRAGGFVAAQLLHAGSTINPAILGEKEALFGPTAMIDPVCGHPVVELSKAHILSIVDDYAKAGLRAKAAGFNAIQIHAAHGYLINQFLSKSRNHRKDKYGGSLKQRALLLYQVYEAIRGEVGSDYPIFIKMSAYDGFPGGVKPQESAQVASVLDDMGINAIEVSAGTPEGAVKNGWDHIIPEPFKEGSLLKYPLQIKERVKCPVISVEGWRSPKEIAKALEKIDAVSMSRPFIREPHLVNRWLEGDDSPAYCISCNKCLSITTKSGLSCIFHKQKKSGA